MNEYEIEAAFSEADYVNHKIKKLVKELKDSNEDLRKRNSELLSHQFDNPEGIYYKGYKLSDLIFLAEACRELEMSPTDLTDNIENIKKIYQRVQDQAWEDFKRQMSSLFGLFK